MSLEIDALRWRFKSNHVNLTHILEHFGLHMYKNFPFWAEPWRSHSGGRISAKSRPLEAVLGVYVLSHCPFEDWHDNFSFEKWASCPPTFFTTDIDRTIIAINHFAAT